MTFLPEGTTAPKSNSEFMNWELGENKFRVAASAITGFELWVEGKPQRRKTADLFTAEELRNADINKFTGNKKTPEYFWAFPVYNYKTERVQILEVKQVTVMRDIESYLSDEDYGSDPTKYDFVVTQYEGANKKIQYSTKAKPPKPLDEGLGAAIRDAVDGVDLTILYRGGYPLSEKGRLTQEDADEVSKHI